MISLDWKVDGVLYVMGVAKMTFYCRQWRREAGGFESLLNKPRCPPKVPSRPVRTEEPVSLIEGLRRGCRAGRGWLSSYL